MAEWILPDEFEDCLPDAAFCRRKESLPLRTMQVKQLLPPIECFKGDFKEFADLLHGVQMESVFCQHPKDEEETVAAVRDDGIRQNGMGRR